MIITNENKAEITRAVQEIATEFRASPGIILTEDDLKCRLFGRLSNSSTFGGVHATADEGISASKVHAEVSWFGDDGKLTIKPDLTILDPSCMSLTRSMKDNMRFPSKRFHFIGQSIIFEIKFVRDGRKFKRSEFKSIERDFEKILGLFERLSGSGHEKLVFCYFVIFSKGHIASEDFANLLDRCRSKWAANWSVIYHGVDVPDTKEK